MNSETQNTERPVGIRDIYRLIPKGKRKGLTAVLAGTVALALLDFIGVVALVSVLLLVLDEQAVFSYPAAQWAYDYFNFASYGAFAAWICAAVLLVIALKSAFTLVVTNSIEKYLLSLYRHFSGRMFDTYLSKGLLFIRANHTSQLVNNVNGVCLRFTEGVIGQLVAILSEAILLLLILTVLLIYNPLIVLLTIAVFLPLALLYMLFFKRRMTENGKMENKLFVQQNKTMYETLRGYSDIEINNAEKYVSENFRKGLHTLTDYRRRASNIRRASGRVVEFSLVLGVVVMIIAGLAMGEEMSSLKISLGIFAIAAYKIVPAVSKIINASVEYRRNSFAARTIADTLNDSAPYLIDGGTGEKLPFKKEITMDGISFGYADREVLKDFSLTIGKGERIGIRGHSGTGKTTLINILCGFFEPSAGSLMVDGVAITPANRRMWQNDLAYVSQDVFLPDISIAENIAFGVNPGDIDRERLRAAIDAASLRDLTDSLPNGADTSTGEGGCRLSGGQRQRIGIARALYKNTSVLIFDEATSSLDSRTEEEIVQSIGKLYSANNALTIIIVSHRESTLAFCDRTIDIAQAQDGK